MNNAIETATISVQMFPIDVCGDFPNQLLFKGSLH